MSHDDVRKRGRGEYSAAAALCITAVVRNIDRKNKNNLKRMREKI